MAQRSRRRRGPAAASVAAGVPAGVLGGAVMLLFVMIVTGWRGLGFLAPVQAFAGVFLGRGAIGGGWGASLLGLVVHFSVAIALGVLFTALALRRTEPLESVAAGIMLATVTWAFLTFVVVRAVDPALMDLAREAPFAWFGGHIVYGIAVASARSLYDVALGDEASAPEAMRSGPAVADAPLAAGARAALAPAPRTRRHVAARVAAALALVGAALGVAWALRRAEA